MANTALQTLITSTLTPANGDTITAQELRTVLTSFNEYIAHEVTYTPTITFSRMLTDMGVQTLTTNTTYTKDLTNAIRGGGTVVRLIGNGTAVPDFTNFTKAAGSADFNSTANAINDVYFFYLGTTHYYNIIHPASQASGNTTPAAPTVNANDTADTLSFSHALGNSEIVVSENNGPYIAYTGTINVGNVTRAQGYWKAKIKAATGRNESAVVESPSFTVAGGADTTPPVIQSAVINSNNPSLIVLGYNENLKTTEVPAAADFPVTVNTVARSVTNVAITGNTVNLTLASGVSNGQTVLVDYTAAGANKVRDLANNAAAAFVSQVVTVNLTSESFEDTTFTLTNITNTAGVYQGTTGGNNFDDSFGVGTKKLPAGVAGKLIFQYVLADIGTLGFAFGWSDTASTKYYYNMRPGFYNPYNYRVVSVLTSNTYPAQNTEYGNLQDGHYYGFNRDVNGVVTVIHSADKVNWDVLHTYPETYSGNLWPVLNLNGFSTNRFTYPQQSNHVV